MQPADQARVACFMVYDMIYALLRHFSGTEAFNLWLDCVDTFRLRRLETPSQVGFSNTLSHLWQTDPKTLKRTLILPESLYIIHSNLWLAHHDCMP